MSDSPVMFSREWYDEYYRRAESSRAHSRFCERVYGRDLGQHGMMDMAELEFLATRLLPNSSLLEIGCGSGHIAEYLHDYLSCTVLGLDYSEVAITQARDRTLDRAEALSFECVDLKSDPVPTGPYDGIIAVDAIYFLDFGDAIRKLNQRLSAPGKLFVTATQYSPDGDPASGPPGHIQLARVLDELQFSYVAYDFTENVRAHWWRNYHATCELEQEFLDEGNEFLLEARRRENARFAEESERDRLSRLLFEIDPNPAIIPQETP